MAKRIYKTKVQLAKAFKVSLTTVQKWTYDGTFPGGRKGPWTHTPVEKWVNSRGADGGAEDDRTLGEIRRQFELAKAEEKTQQALKLDILNKKLMARLCDRDEVTAEVQAMLARARDVMMQIPDRAAIDLPAELKPAALARWRYLVTDLLSEMANWSSRIGKNKRA